MKTDFRVMLEAVALVGLGMLLMVVVLKVIL